MLFGLPPRGAMMSRKVMWLLSARANRAGEGRSHWAHLPAISAISHGETNV